MFSKNPNLETAGVAYSVPSKNPNLTSSYDIREEAYYGETEEQLAEEKQYDRFDKNRLYFKSIFDQPTTGLPSVTAGVKVTQADGLANGYNRKNPNYIGSEQINNVNQGLQAEQEITKMSAINRAIREKNFQLAEMLLGRPLTQDDLKVVTNSVYYKSNAPQGVIYKTFNIQDITSLTAYLKSLDDNDIGYKIKNSGAEVFVISGPDVEKDLPKSITINLSKSMKEEEQAAEDVWEFLNRKKVKVPSDINFKKDELLKIASALGVKHTNTDTRTDLLRIIKDTIFNTPELRAKLTSRKGELASSSSSSASDDSSSAVANAFATTPTKRGDKKFKKKEVKGNDGSSNVVFVDTDDDGEEGLPATVKKEEGKATSGNGIRRQLYGTMSNSKMKSQLDVTMGMLNAGNNSVDLLKDLAFLLQCMYDRNIISKYKMNRITKMYLGNI